MTVDAGNITHWIIWAGSLLVMLQAMGLSNTVGFHRLLTHKSFKTRPWLRNTLALLCAQYSGSPMLWVGVHRVHHTISDWKTDPHTPKNGFWWAHCGWLCGTPNPLACALFALSGFGLHARFAYWDVQRLLGWREENHKKMTRDLEKEWFMRMLDLPFAMLVMLAVQVAAAWLIAGWWGMLWLWALHFTLNNSTWLVNSVCHWPTVGTRPFDSKDESRNVRWLCWLTYGEASHNAHHKYPKSAKHGLLGEPDMSWRVIRLFERLGWAWDVQLPKEFREPEPAAAAPEPAVRPT